MSVLCALRGQALPRSGSPRCSTGNGSARPAAPRSACECMRLPSAPDERRSRMIDIRGLLVVSLIGLVVITAAGCGDASRATASPPAAVVKVKPSQAQVEQAIAKVAQDEAQVKRAEATQRQTELDVNRYTPLAQRGSVSQQELDNAVQSNEANLAAVAAARAAVLNSQASVSQSRAALEKALADVKTQEANIAAARAALADARLNLGYTRVLSPIAGVAGFRGANIGDYVGPSDSTPLTTVSQVDPIYAQFPVSEQRALTVLRRWAADPSEPRRLELQLILADGTVYSHPGRAAALDRQVDVTSGTVLARGVFPNPGNLLRPGQYAKVRAVVEVKKAALLIPQRAVQDVQGIHQVAVVRAADTVDIRKIKVDVRVGSLWMVTEGLKPGERVVVEGGDRVRAGQKVRLAANTPAESSAAAK